MSTSRAPRMLSIAACLLIVSGCTTAEPPVPEIDVASTVSATVETRLGFAPDVTCDTFDAVIEGAVLTCAITDPATDETYDAEITLVDVRPDGSFSVDLKVASQP